jgi:phosphoribosylformylglycinamidine synthase subunit PurQ / glutaminase
MVNTCIVTGYGINADLELSEAFKAAGAQASRVHINDLIEKPALLSAYGIIAFPGGFSFGDHLGSGKVFGNLFKSRLKPELDAFIASGKLVIGICNGFQVLVKMGILPNLAGSWDQDVSLIHNDSGKFEDRWVTCGFEAKSPCVWTKRLGSIDLPVRHGEGKFVISSATVEKALLDEKLAAAFYRSRSDGRIGYPDNPNGSAHDIAGICDRTGRVFGLMPHPEAFIFPEQHPRWKRERITEGSGLAIFRNAVRYFG